MGQELIEGLRVSTCTLVSAAVLCRVLHRLCSLDLLSVCRDWKGSRAGQRAGLHSTVTLCRQRLALS